MGFRRRTTTTVPPATRRRSVRPGEGTLLAAAEPLTERLEKTSAVEQPWQREVWDAYRAVPELRTAARVTAGAMSQCRLILARVSPTGDPVPLDYGTPEDPGPDYDHPGRELLDLFAGGMGGQAALLDKLGVLLTLTGEGVAVGAYDTRQSRLDPMEVFKLYSPAQVVARNKAIVVRESETSTGDRLIDPEVTASVRIWREDAQFSWESDSAGRAALPVLREIMLYDQHLKTTAISRLASAGLLFIPEDMTLPGGAPEEDGEDGAADPFMLFLMEVMSTAIKDRESAAANVPIAIRASAEDIEAVRHLMFSTPFGEKILEPRAAAVERLAVTVDMPPELLTGLGGTKHWTGSLITDSWVNTYLAELMSFACGALTSGWLWPALSRVAPSIPADVIVWHDPSSIQTRPNIGPDAKDLYDRNELSGDALRRATGFDDGDKPGPKDLERTLLIQLVTAAPALAPIILPILGIQLGEEAAAAIAETLGDQPFAETPAEVVEPDTAAPVPGSVEPTITERPQMSAAAMAEFFWLLQRSGLKP